MFFIFGWGHREKKDLGPTFKIKCPHCDKTEYWKLLQLKTYFTLFFIPIFPYESKTFLLCPVCTNGFDLPEPIAAKARMIADFHLQFANKKITEYEYQVKIENNYAEAFNAFKEFVQGTAKKAEGSVLCPFCGQIVHNETGGLFIDKSCTKCGKELPLQVIQQVKLAFPEKWRA